LIFNLICGRKNLRMCRVKERAIRIRDLAAADASWQSQLSVSLRRERKLKELLSILPVVLHSRTQFHFVAMDLIGSS